MMGDIDIFLSESLGDLEDRRNPVDEASAQLVDYRSEPNGLMDRGQMEVTVLNRVN
jgi:hypothetical protein